jgi:hypothetical protein
VQWLLMFALLAPRAGEASQGTAVREIFSLGDARGTTPFTALLLEGGRICLRYPTRAAPAAFPKE